MALNSANGLNGHVASKLDTIQRFAHIPHAVSVAVADPDADGYEVELNLDDINEDPTELCTLLEIENTQKSMWIMVAMAYAKRRRTDDAIEVLTRALGAMSRAKADDRLSLLNVLCWMYLFKCREAPRIKPEGQLASEARTKDYYSQQATSVLNDASRISPSYPPLFLARGVLYLLKASLHSPTKSGLQANQERVESLRQASKCFEDALRASNGKNVMALMGKARVQFSLGKFGESLELYQSVLYRAPECIDPDPRIGIGCCFWQLGYKEDAKAAWARALELNPDSKISNILLSLYFLQASSQYQPSDPQFAPLYTKAMTKYAQKAFKMDDKLPLSCATFGGYFLLKKSMAHVERLARRAIDLTDVSAIASDGWYLLARKEHYDENLAKANDFYNKADQARGGEDRGYPPAKFGAAQIKILMQDFDGAKFRLDKIVQQSKSIEAMTLLGTLYAEDLFATQATSSKEDKSADLKKAMALLESVRIAWKDPKKKTSPDSSVLLNLARLYEVESPEKSLQCLQQVEQMEIDEIPDEDRPEDVDDEGLLRSFLREYLPPQLLNNMGCFYYQMDKFGQARELFQSGLNACVKIGDKESALDTDAIVTTISFNLARTYEAESMPDEAKRVYEGLLERHSDYTDATTRLTYIKLRQDPGDEGPKAIQKLYQAEPSNLEVRSLYGWYLSKAKRRTNNIAEDQEQRHYKHTLQHYDKHDRYSLTGMGNIYLTIAREMPRNTEQDKEKRRKMYEKSVEFFDKALQLDARNAYAAQGIGIALVEDKKDLPGAVQIFTKVKETMKDPSVFINLGHVYCELKQYSRAIENYEAALAKDRARDPQILACLGRVWLMRGKQEKNIDAMKESLEYSRRALEVAPEQIHFKFNVAFVQNQIAQLIYTLPDHQRALEDVEAAAKDLEEAIESFSAIAKSPNPPFPKNDIEMRANMSRNTMRKQLERAIQSQREYEEKNAAKVKQAREIREAALKKREEEKKMAEEAALETKRKIAEERQRMEEQDRAYQEKRAEEERRRHELMEEEEERKVERSAKRGKGKRKKKGDESGSDGEVQTDGGRRRRDSVSSDTAASSGDERPRQKKKRKLERKGKASSKIKSSELILDSDEEVGADDGLNENTAPTPNGAASDPDNDKSSSRPRKSARIIDEDEDEDDDVGNENEVSMEDAVSGHSRPVIDNDSDE